jgi:hypothetical protein
MNSRLFALGVGRASAQNLAATNRPDQPHLLWPLAVDTNIIPPDFSRIAIAAQLLGGTDSSEITEMVFRDLQAYVAGTLDDFDFIAVHDLPPPRIRRQDFSAPVFGSRGKFLYESHISVS